MPAMSSFHSTPRAAELNVWIMLSPTFAHFINNKFIGSRSGRQFEKRSPVDGSLIGMVPEAGDSEVDAAVEAAQAALLAPGGDCHCLSAPACWNVAAEIDRRADEFIDAEVHDTGKPRALASHLDIRAVRRTFGRLPIWSECADGMLRDADSRRRERH